MALFIKKTNVGTHVPLYSLSQQDTWLVVGLGNIGREYNGTRHNIGFEVLDELASKLDVSFSEKPSLKSLVATKISDGKRIILCKPTTFMNNSGEAVQAVKNFYKVDLVHVVVVHDELDLLLGTIKSKQGGGSAGHNGIKSLSQHIGEDYWRVRIGIGPKKPEQIDSANFVLAKFSAAQKKKLQNILTDSLETIAAIFQA